MRLTLRNLLLYLDHQMSPGDAQEFADKIQHSEFATGLIERIRSVTRVRRMPAPKLDDKGLGGDPNTVSDYIENLLPQERIKEFDKLCLDSDMQLAEVASCHHILTLVLGKPVEPSDELRERMYKVPQLAAAGKAARVDHPHEPVPPPPPASPPPAPGTAAAPEPVHLVTKADVPDYLRAGRRSWIWPLAATVVVTFLLVALVLRAMGPFDQRHPLAKWLGMAPVEIANNLETPVDSGQPGPGGITPTDDGSAGKQDVMPDESNPEPDKADVAATKPETPAEEKPADAADEKPAEKPEVKTVRTNPREDDPFVPKKLGSDEKPAPEEKPATTKIAESGVPLVEVGRYLSDEQLLGRLDAKTALWMRVPPRALLVADEPLVSFPAFRPQLALASSLQVTLVGEAAVSIPAPGLGMDGVPNLNVNYGRLLVVTDGKAGGKILLDLDGVKGLVTFTDPGTELAIDVHRYLAPGADAEAKAGPRVIEVITLSGSATWQESESEPVKIPANQAFTFVEESLAEVRGPYRAPDWVDPRPLAINSLDRETRQVLERTLAFDRSLNLSLEEQAEHRRVEVRSLAARCLVCLNRFAPAVANLHNDKLMSFWAYDIDALRAALSRGPETAALVRQEVGMNRGPDAALLYRLIRGYSPEQLGGERGATELVDALDHQELDVRVLAFDNLWRITGAMYNYRPERKPLDLNRTPIARFRERIKDGTLTYKTPPSPIPEHKPLGK